MTAAYLYDAVRTPFGRFNGALAGVRPDDLAAHVIRPCSNATPTGRRRGRRGDLRQRERRRRGQPESRPDGESAGWATRQRTGDHRQPALRLESGRGHDRLTEHRGRRRGDRHRRRRGVHDPITMGVDEAGPALPRRRHHRGLDRPRLAAGEQADAARVDVSLGESNEQLREKFDISRERQDAFAYRSHRLAAQAWEDGFYDDLVTAVPNIELARDEGVRADTTVEKLAKLKPSFRPDGTITAGNASPLNDGASALLIGSEKAADMIGRSPVARIAGRGAAALEPQMFGYAPVEAAEIALRRAGIAWREVGAVELNEAFAVQSLACIDAWGVDPDMVNSRGGAIAIGHPLGASGGRILGTLAKVLREDGHRWGVAAICIGVGQGLAVVLENLNTVRKAA